MQFETSCARKWQSLGIGIDYRGDVRAFVQLFKLHIALCLKRALYIVRVCEFKFAVGSNSESIICYFFMYDLQ